MGHGPAPAARAGPPAPLTATKLWGQGTQAAMALPQLGRLRGMPKPSGGSGSEHAEAVTQQRWMCHPLPWPGTPGLQPGGKAAQGDVSLPLPIRCSWISPVLTYNHTGAYFHLAHSPAKLDSKKMQPGLETIQHQRLHNISVAEQKQHSRVRDSHGNTWES